MRPRPTFAGLFLAVTLSALSLSRTPAGAQAPSLEQVRQMLSAYEDLPPERAWRALGPQTLELLVRLYEDPSRPTFLRLRAVWAAAHYPSGACRTFLRAVAGASNQRDLFVRAAVLALGRAFGPQALDDIAPYLDHERAVVREAAVLALGRVGTQRARRVLRARLAIERHDLVRRSLARALR